MKVQSAVKTLYTTLAVSCQVSKKGEMIAFFKITRRLMLCLRCPVSFSKTMRACQKDFIFRVWFCGQVSASSKMKRTTNCIEAGHFISCYIVSSKYFQLVRRTIGRQQISFCWIDKEKYRNWRVPCSPGERQQCLAEWLPRYIRKICDCGAERALSTVRKAG